jgi:hypothetical protein
MIMDRSGSLYFNVGYSNSGYSYHNGDEVEEIYVSKSDILNDDLLPDNWRIL